MARAREVRIRTRRGVDAANGVSQSDARCRPGRALLRPRPLTERNLEPMTLTKSGRPAASECGEYYGKYIDLVPGDDIVSSLEHELTSALFLLRAVSPEQAEHRYAPDKWSVKEVVGHL